MKLGNNELINCNDIGVKFSTGNPLPTLADLWDRKLSKKKNGAKYFWALQNVSFSVRQGEILGLIGNNGAGKSTLLRVVAEILQPDKGTVTINTTCHLLSSGIGTREQLSGRENIILGSLYLGHSITEIKKNFDAMVEFSGLGEHIDRPIRYYSDGMLSRLSFTIATSIKPEFLLLDELLGAGDITFRDKASKRMKEVALGSKGAIIATHDMFFVLNHCSKALYLDKGSVRFYGDPKDAVDLYMKDNGLGTSKEFTV